MHTRSLLNGRQFITPAHRENADHLANQLPAAAAPAATALYPHVAALRIASRPSALDISAVVWQLRREPPAANASAIAAAETLSGISVMSRAAYCPKAKYEFSTLPPSFSIGPRTASKRSWGLAMSRVRASGV